MTKSTNKLILILLSLLVLNSCKDEITESNTDKFLSFKIEASVNEGLLTKDIIGKIENQKIVLEIPGSLSLNNLIASFTFQGKDVYVGNARQISGKTSNNYSNPLTFTIVSDNGFKTDYAIEIIKIEDTESFFSSFGFLRENNEFLLHDYSATITDNKIEISLPSTTKSLVAVYETNASEVLIDEVAQSSKVSINDFSKPIIYTLVSKEGIKKNYTLNITWTSSIPQINITTDNSVPITSKDDYVYADISVIANGWGDDYSGRTRIRGRGNSTWGLPKKPYRLKLDNDENLLNLAAEKDWVLLANYLDPTLMLNAVAFKIGQLIELQYTNHAIPIDLTINGKYAGNYMLTEQVEISKSRVNVDKNDGVLLELDINYDEDFQFKSDNYKLPVMVKDPDVESDAQFQKIKDDFHQLENALASASFPNSGYKNYIDIESLVKYLIIYNLTQNMEINHPKSTYLYKDISGKYYMGPIWDFDWGYNYEGTQVHFGSYSSPLFRKLTPTSTGYDFFTHFMDDPEIKRLYKETWTKFKAEKMPELIKYVDFYAAHIAESQKNDQILWNNGTTNFPYKINQFKNWLAGRANYIDTYVQEF